MRVAAIYDIHGNLPALEAVLDDIRQAKADQIVVGGDVLPGPMPRQTLDCLLSLDIPVRFIQGNGERDVLTQKAGRDTPNVPESVRPILRWVGEQLHPEFERTLANWPQTLRVRIDGPGEVLFCHATPRSDTELFTRLTPDEHLLPVFQGLGVAMVVCGHTHMQFDRTIAGIRVVNAGSVGMPIGDPAACWLLLGGEVQLRRTRYDLASAAERIRATDYPQAAEFAARSILQPPSKAEMLEAFSRAEQRQGGKRKP